MHLACSERLRECSFGLLDFPNLLHFGASLRVHLLSSSSLFVLRINPCVLFQFRITSGTMNPCRNLVIRLGWGFIPSQSPPAQDNTTQRNEDIHTYNTDTYMPRAGFEPTIHGFLDRVICVLDVVLYLYTTILSSILVTRHELTL
jgi:hypothetical protein